jgi:hypothetical protein
VALSETHAQASMIDGRLRMGVGCVLSSVVMVRVWADAYMIPSFFPFMYTVAFLPLTIAWLLGWRS